MASPVDLPQPGGDTARQFAFQVPSATSVRFLVLITATLGATLPLAQLLVDAARQLNLLPAHGRAGCVAEAQAQVGVLPDQELLATYLACAEAATRGDAVLLLGVVLLPPLLGVAFYTAHPVLLRRRLRALCPSVHAALYRQVVTALRDAELPNPQRVRVLVTPGTTGGARAFGAWGRYWIAVDRSLLVPAHDPGPPSPTADAVLQHEAAHLRNRDIDITYLTIGVWWGFATVAGLTLALLPFADEPATRWVVPLLLALAVLGYARARVLRIREYYADARAGQRADVRAALVVVLERALAVRQTSGTVRWWDRLRRNHPVARRRVAALRDPRLLLRGEPVALVIVGCAVSLGTPGLYMLIIGFTVDDPGWIASHVTGVAAGVPLAVVLTLTMWRATLGFLLGTERQPTAWRAGVSLTAGVLVGQLLLPGLPETTWGAQLLVGPGVFLGLVLALALLAGFVLIARWVSGNAALWLSVCRGRWPLGMVAAGAASLLGLVMTSWFSVVQLVSLTPPHWESVLTWSIATLFTSSRPWLVVSLGFGILVPVMAWVAWQSARQPDGVSWGRRAGQLLCPSWLPALAALLTAGVLSILLALLLPMFRIAGGLLLGAPAAATGDVGLVLVLLPIFGFATLLVGIGGVVLGWQLGGRGASPRGLYAALAYGLVVAVLTTPAIHLGVAVGDCGRAGGVDSACWAGHVPESLYLGLGPFAGLVLCLFYLPTAGVAALVGSGVRRLARRPPWIVARPRRRWPGVVGVAAIALPVTIFLVDEATTATTGVPVPRATEQPGAAESEPAPEVESGVSSREACAAMDTHLAQLANLDSLPPVMGTAESQWLTLHTLEQSEEPVLRAFASVPLARDRCASPVACVDEGALFAAGQYCAVVHPGTGIVR
ncbi:M48 family metalloprotease [Lipingzhangella sp. LS1_29]|uniref:M48 family metalloprotease n=1 Tax=Lipingzhangella rawalii TaxID=2055835 RepID=A0ABU2H633_9ACTN|nr:M48 family metalloprotease [Lipingzhangella rawalii]MDS1270738.1 M48 family metalloprotease [Lipingzhangella rawalii]